MNAPSVVQLAYPGKQQQISDLVHQPIVATPDLGRFASVIHAAEGTGLVVDPAKTARVVDRTRGLDHHGAGRGQIGPRRFFGPAADRDVGSARQLGPVKVGEITCQRASRLAVPAVDRNPNPMKVEDARLHSLTFRCGSVIESFGVGQPALP